MRSTSDINLLNGEDNIASSSDFQRNLLTLRDLSYPFSIPFCTTKCCKTHVARQCTALHAGWRATKERCESHSSDPLRNQARSPIRRQPSRSQSQLACSRHLRQLVGKRAQTPPTLTVSLTRPDAWSTTGGMKTILTFLTVSLLTGCASTWYQPGKTPQQAWQDYNQCQIEAARAADPTGIGMASDGGARGDVKKHEQAIAESCMRAKGYLPLKDQTVPNRDQYPKF
jgi:hypothetical protein